MKVVRGDILEKLIIKAYLSHLTEEEKKEYLENIENNDDPRNLSFWTNIMGLYPAPKLRSKVRRMLLELLKEQ